MKNPLSTKYGKCALLFFVAAPGSLFADAPTSTLAVPPGAEGVKINFDRDIRPILETSCLRCHGGEKPKSHFRLDNRVSALKGGDNNTNDIVPGDSSRSLLIKYVTHQVADMDMPPEGKGEPLTPRQIGLLKSWIDEGVNWDTTNQIPQSAFVFAPTIRWTSVEGSQGKFRELEGTKPGLGYGVEKFSAVENFGPDEKMSLDGHFIIPDRDLQLGLALDRTGLGFVHAGFQDWRTYYDDVGGYNPALTPPAFDAGRDLHVDNGRAWLDLGLTLPQWPVIVLGYEYQFKKGTKAMLDWGGVQQVDIYPATKAVDEQTHIVKLDVTYDADDWHLENNARVEFYRNRNEGAESQILFGGPAPDTFINTRDKYDSIQGMDTLVVEKQIRDWWFLSGGAYYSRLRGNDYFSQTTAIPAFDFSSTLASQKIILKRESEIFSVANLFAPLDCLTLSLGSQNEWTRENSFGTSVPDLELNLNEPDGSDLEKLRTSQSANIRFTKIPFTVLFADARFDQENIVESQEEDPVQFNRRTDSFNNRHDIKAGFNTSPWRWMDLNAQYHRQSSVTDYDHLQDVYNGIPADATNGYPAFILNRNIRTDGLETRLALRPARWLKTTFTYQIADTDYSSKTDPAFDHGLLSQPVSPGGTLWDGRYFAQTYGVNAVVTPVAWFYFSGGFTFSRSSTTTAANGDPTVTAYQGNIYTANGTMTCAFNAKSSGSIGYVFTRADYGQNNPASAIPFGLDFTRHEVRAGLNRQITRRLAGVLQYRFSQYAEPGAGSFNNFTAHGIFASFVYQWP